MNETIKQFSINDVNLFKDDDSADFALAEIYFLSDGNNAQNCPIPTEVLKRDAKTVLGKFVVAKFDKWVGDVTSHDTEEVIIGYVPMESEVRFVEKDGRTFAVCNAIISKIYSTEVYNLFKEENYRSVSSEFSCSQPNANEMGEGEVDALIVRGITLLGKSVRPAISGANMQIKKFSEKEADEYYLSLNNPLKKFADERDEKLNGKIYKVNKTELKDKSWGDVDKVVLRNKVMSAKNKSTLVKDVYLLVESGWEDAPSEHLKYPVMELVGDTFYYNRGALSSALAYAKQENETTVISKVEKLYKKFKLNDKDKEDKMSDIKEKEDVVMAQEEETKVDDKEKEVEKKEMSAEEEKEMGCDKAMSDEEEKDEVKEGKEEDSKEEKVEEKSMSEQAKEFAESETDKEYIGKMFSQELKGMVSEILELKKFQETRLELDKTNKLNSIMASVKGDLDEKQFTELQAEGTTKTFAELDSFENKVKAFAYEASKGKEKQDDGIMKFAGQGKVQTKAELTADDIFNKYL